MKKGVVDEAISHYSSLFTLPSLGKVLGLVIAECMLIGLLTGSLENLPIEFLERLQLGLLILLLTVSADYLSGKILGKKHILSLRRRLFLSFASNFLFLIFIVLANLLSPAISFKVYCLGLYASLSLRLVVMDSISSSSSSRNFISAALQPLLFLSPLITKSSQLTSSEAYAIIVSIIASLSAAKLFIRTVNTVGLRSLGIPTIRMFRAFIANWTEGQVKPIEEILETSSEMRDVKLSAITFRSGGEIKAAIIVSDIHPGPFKNIGSSAFPSLIQRFVEKAWRCIVSVPHGISGHGFDLASRSQNLKVIRYFLKNASFNDASDHATPFVSIKRGGVTACCQIFGNCAILSLTLAPETMEDLPSQLVDFINTEARKRGLSFVMAIDAHNSIQGAFNPENVIEPMKGAITDVLDAAVKLERLTFNAGSSKIVPNDFSVENGMGPGGIVVTAVKVGEQVSAYITIDGNNMVSGLREKILSSLKEVGVDIGEVFTTDTHIVNAVTMAKRGYHPVGEAIDHDKLINYIKIAAKESVMKLKPSSASCCQIMVPRVRVIGERQIERLCNVINEASKSAKVSSALIFPAFSLALILALIIM
ncbi:MAG: DUF2070 family protein [Candidatus Bathyarchaeota archaeon]|nr:DUF2070 family protein [Candidatus Bathyarchaeota archaeon]